MFEPAIIEFHELPKDIQSFTNRLLPIDDQVVLCWYVKPMVRFPMVLSKKNIIKFIYPRNDDGTVKGAPSDLFIKTAELYPHNNIEQIIVEKKDSYTKIRILHFGLISLDQNGRRLIKIYTSEGDKLIPYEGSISSTPILMMIQDLARAK